MTLPEFKAWLDGFKEAMGDAPTHEQWQKVLAKLQEVVPTANYGQFTAPGGKWPPNVALTAGGSLHVPHAPSIRVNN